MGIAYKFDDNINTDYIISSHRKRDTVDPVRLYRFMMEDIRMGFGEIVKEGDFIVAGRNFGCGSAMEIAPLVILASGIKAVIAKSYSRSFYRNAINLGLLVLEADTDQIDEGDEIDFFSYGNICNHTKGTEITTEVFPEMIREILDSGGIMAYMEKMFG